MRFCVCLCVFVSVCVCLCVGSVCVRERYAVGGPSGLGLASPASTECWEDELAKRRLHLLCLLLLLLLLLFLLFLLLFRGGVTDLFGERGPVWQTRLQVWWWGGGAAIAAPPVPGLSMFPPHCCLLMSGFSLPNAHWSLQIVGGMLACSIVFAGGHTMSNAPDLF